MPRLREGMPLCAPWCDVVRMADGNRRPNYDGALFPPVFIGPGDPYDDKRCLRDFYAGSRTGGLRCGAKPTNLRQWWHKPGAAGHVPVRRAVFSPAVPAGPGTVFV